MEWGKKTQSRTGHDYFQQQQNARAAMTLGQSEFQIVLSECSFWIISV
jgi:hypothetical protein